MPRSYCIYIRPKQISLRLSCRRHQEVADDGEEGEGRERGGGKREKRREERGGENDDEDAYDGGTLDRSFEVSNDWKLEVSSKFYIFSF